MTFPQKIQKTIPNCDHAKESLPNRFTVKEVCILQVKNDFLDENQPVRTISTKELVLLQVVSCCDATAGQKIVLEETLNVTFL